MNNIIRCDQDVDSLQIGGLGIRYLMIFNFLQAEANNV